MGLIERQAFLDDLLAFRIIDWNKNVSRHFKKKGLNTRNEIIKKSPGGWEEQKLKKLWILIWHQLPLPQVAGHDVATAADALGTVMTSSHHEGCD